MKLPSILILTIIIFTVTVIAGTCTHLGCGENRGGGSHSHWYTISHTRYKLHDGDGYTVSPTIIPCSCYWNSDDCTICEGTEN